MPEEYFVFLNINFAKIYENNISFLNQFSLININQFRKIRIECLLKLIMWDNLITISGVSAFSPLFRKWNKREIKTKAEH